MTTTRNPRLDTIVTRHRSNRLRDAVFAAIVVLVSAVSVTTVTSAVDGAAVNVAHR